MAWAADRAAYSAAFASYEPQADDHPSAIPFYRLWLGLRAVLGTDTVERFHHWFHSAYQYVYAPDAGDWASVVRAIQLYAGELKLPPEPQRRIPWHLSEPDAAKIPARAREIFEDQFRAKYPGKRINSKLAREKWAEVEGKALEFATQEYDGEIKRYETELARHNAGYEQEMARWQEQADAIAGFKRVAQAIGA